MTVVRRGERSGGAIRPLRAVALLGGLLATAIGAQAEATEAPADRVLPVDDERPAHVPPWETRVELAVQAGLAAPIAMEGVNLGANVGAAGVIRPLTWFSVGLGGELTRLAWSTNFGPEPDAWIDGRSLLLVVRFHTSLTPDLEAHGQLFGGPLWMSTTYSNTQCTDPFGMTVGAAMGAEAWTSSFVRVGAQLGFQAGFAAAQACTDEFDPTSRDIPSGFAPGLLVRLTGTLGRR